ncbi:MAG TPA: 4Fe-4S binding protein [Anaerolineales bacterium]|nr:4Fe-4S binding protein [Anaerolineales bacterium]
MGLKNWFIKPSTRAFVKEARKAPGYSFFDLVHGYVYARWPYLYIGIGTGEHPLSKWFAPLSGRFNSLVTKRKRDETAHSHIHFADTYHGKAVSLETAKSLVSIHEEIEIHDLEQVIPYKRARSIIMRNPDHIVVLDCPCRSARPNPCLPLDVCLIIGEPFASFVHEHHPERSRRITPDEAIAILKAEDERGHVHHAFFKDAMLDRFYAICNCCRCCCGAMQAHRSGTPMLASSGYVSQVDEDLCIGCGDCVTYCQFNALEVVDGMNHVVYKECMGCGICTSKCGQGALSLVRDDAKGVPLEICSVMKETIIAE